MEKIYKFLKKQYYWIAFAILLPFLLIPNFNPAYGLIISYITINLALLGLQKLISVEWHKLSNDEQLHKCFNFLNKPEELDYVYVGKILEFRGRKIRKNCYIAKNESHLFLVCLDRTFAPIPDFYYETSLETISKVMIESELDKSKLTVVSEGNFVIIFEVYFLHKEEVPFVLTSSDRFSSFLSEFNVSEN